MLNVFTSDEKKVESPIYFLMHKEHVVATLLFNNVSGQLVDAIQIDSEDLIPVGHLPSLASLRKWWSERALPTTRKGLQQVLHVTGKLTSEALLLGNLGLSLSDHYWVSPKVLATANEIPEQRRTEIVGTFKQKLKMLEDFQNGCKLWKSNKYRW